MRVPSAAELLAAWEEGVTLNPVQQSVLLLALVCPEKPLAEVSLGERDALLLALRERLFGSRLHSLAVCPGCGEQLELDFEVNDIRAPTPTRTLPAGEFSVREGDFIVRCRLPCSADLLAVADCPDPEAARQELLTRCVLGVELTAGGVAATVAELPSPVVEAVAEQMQQADPQGDVQLSLNCPSCHRSWLMAFDIASYLWAEVGDWAQRTLREVHSLAWAYGWRESDILAMSVRRRRWYLELIGA